MANSAGDEPVPEEFYRYAREPEDQERNDGEEKKDDDWTKNDDLMQACVHKSEEEQGQRSFGDDDGGDEDRGADGLVQNRRWYVRRFDFHYVPAEAVIGRNREHDIVGDEKNLRSDTSV